MTQSRPPDHFARLYQSNPDPWGFQTNPYEQDKYARSVDVLRRDRPFASGLEVGCSIGVLTRMLAPLCDALLGLDVVDQALADASQRCADQPWVRFARMRAPDEWPEGRFDLIVLSEVLYFLSPDDIDRCAVRVRDSLLPDARVLLVNWLGETDDPSSGDQAAERFIAAMAGRLTVAEQGREPRYRLDLLR
jgi:SAM-dependent methyltransferase